MSFLDFPGLQYFYNKYLKPIKPHAREETIKSYTVNEQGHVPDAQLVVQLKEENESLQEEIEKLNSALEGKIDNLQWTKSVEYVNNFCIGGVSFFMIDSDVAHQIDLPDSSWWYVLHIAKPDNTGFAVQFFIELHGNGRVFRRWSSESAWVGRNW